MPCVVDCGNPMQLLQGDMQLLCKIDLFFDKQIPPFLLPVVAEGICVCAAQGEHKAVNVSLVCGDGVLFSLEVCGAVRTEQAVLRDLAPDNAGTFRNVIQHNAERFRISGTFQRRFKRMGEHLACILARGAGEVIRIFRCILNSRNLFHELTDALALRAGSRTGRFYIAFLVQTKNILCSPGYEAGGVGAGRMLRIRLIFTRLLNIRR